MADSRSKKVIVTRRLPASAQQRMAELFDVELNEADAPFSKDQLIDAVQRADVLVPTVTDLIDDEIIAAAGKQLKLIASFGTGIDHLDIAAANKRRILVTNTPGVLTEDVAETVMALILGVSRRLSEGERLVRAGDWKGWGPTLMLGHRVAGKDLGIIGLGRIGQAVAKRARAFGLKVHYHNRNPVHPEIEAELGIKYWESLDQMLANMDLISVNCPHTPATYHLLSARRLKLLQPHAILINTARGGVVDETTLAEMLADGRLAGAGLDVYEHEPEIDPGLLALDNVMLLPHIGSATHEGREAMGDRVVLNIKVALDGHRPPDWVIEGLPRRPHKV